jgi:hypothetical protein
MLGAMLGAMLGVFRSSLRYTPRALLYATEAGRVSNNTTKYYYRYYRGGWIMIS